MTFGELAEEARRLGYNVQSSALAAVAEATGVQVFSKTVTVHRRRPAVSEADLPKLLESFSKRD